MKNYDLCMALAKSDGASEIKAILKAEGHWDNPSAWRDYGDKANNYSTIGNQQSQPINALIEKLINAGDSILTSKVKEAGIDPEDSSSAPTSMKEAKKDFLNIPFGDINQLDAKQRGALARDCGGVVVTGDNKKPTYAIWDFGEGQSPENFPTTLCGLSESNKQKIACNQGKHSSGGTGALVFCEEGVQLTIARKSPKIHDKSSSDDIGFTVTRKFPAGSNKSPSYKYLVINGEVPSFPAKPLTILPTEGDEDPFVKDWEYGCFVKLFGFSIGPRLRSVFNIDLSYKLSVHLINPVFPHRFYERRSNSGKGNSPEITMSGLLTRLDTDRSNSLEANMPFSFNFSVEGQNFTGSIYVLSGTVEKKDLKRWHGDDGILFTVNGQANAFKSKAIYGKRNIGLNYLKDRIITILDCTDLDNDHHAELFQNDRERLKTTTFTNNVLSELEDILGTHQGLKKIQDEHRSESVKNKLSNNQPLENVVEKLLKSNKSLNSILLSGTRISSPFGHNKSKGSWVPNKFPSYFSLDKKNKKYDKNNPRKVELTRKANFGFYTDASNDYFSRSVDPGSYEVIIDGVKAVNKPTLQGSNGVWHLRLDIPNASVLGQKIEVKLQIGDVSKHTPLEEIFWIEVNPFVVKSGGGASGKKCGKGKGKGGKTTSIQHQLPPLVEVNKNDDKWKEFGWDDTSVFKIVPYENTYDIYINMDNVYLLTELKAAGTDADEEVATALYRSSFLLISLNIIAMDKAKQLSDIGAYTDQISNAMSPIIIPMMRDLGSSIAA